MTLEEVEKDWTRLGADDPLWAVLVASDKRNGKWDPDEFLATGRAEIDAALATLAKFGGTPVKTERALDFGCGAGRLTQALAGHYDEAVGIDISPPMLDMARRLDRTDGRCTFRHNATADLALVPTASVDLVYTSLVLQHLPPELVPGYISEFSRILRPGGAACLVMPTATRLTPQGLLFRFAPHEVVRTLQERVLHYPAPMRMHTIPPHQFRALLVASGLSVLGTTDEPDHGPHWVFTRFYAVKPDINC